MQATHSWTTRIRRGALTDQAVSRPVTTFGEHKNDSSVILNGEAVRLSPFSVLFSVPTSDGWSAARGTLKTALAAGGPVAHPRFPFLMSKTQVETPHIATCISDNLYNRRAKLRSAKLKIREA